MLGWPAAGRVLRRAGDGGAGARGKPAFRPRPRPRGAHRFAPARPQAARGDSQSHPARRGAADPRRADLQPRAHGSGRAARDPSPPARRGQGYRVHHPQAAGSSRRLRRGGGAACRPCRRPCAGRRRQSRPAGRDDGRPRHHHAAHARPAPARRGAAGGAGPCRAGPRRRDVRVALRAKSSALPAWTATGSWNSPRRWPDCVASAPGVSCSTGAMSLSPRSRRGCGRAWPTCRPIARRPRWCARCRLPRT